MPLHTEPHISLVSCLMFLGSMNSFLLACSIYYRHRSDMQTNRYLVAILVFIGLELLHEFLIDTNYIYWVQPLTGGSLQLDPLFGPLIFLYVNGLTHPNVREKHHKVWIHFLPALLYCLPMSLFYTLNFQEKLTFSQHGYMLAELPSIAGFIIPICMAVIAIFFSGYLGYSIKLLVLHQRRIADYFSYREKITLNWLSCLLLVCTLYWLLIMAYAFLSGLSEPTKPLVVTLMVFSVAAIHYFGIMGLLQPLVYKSAAPESHIQGEVQKYKKSALSDGASRDILCRLSNMMNEEKPYMNSCLTLPSLAEKVAVSPQYLSQVINEQLNMNFFDYINSHRIEVAKQLLICPLSHTTTILDIAMESAFNSKSSFYTAFKKHTNLTPAQYKKLNT